MRVSLYSSPFAVEFERFRLSTLRLARAPPGILRAHGSGFFHANLGQVAVGRSRWGNSSGARVFKPLHPWLQQLVSSSRLIRTYGLCLTGRRGETVSRWRVPSGRRSDCAVRAMHGERRSSQCDECHVPVGTVSLMKALFGVPVLPWARRPGTWRPDARAPERVR